MSFTTGSIRTISKKRLPPKLTKALKPTSRREHPMSDSGLPPAITPGLALLMNMSKDALLSDRPTLSVLPPIASLPLVERKMKPGLAHVPESEVRVVFSQEKAVLGPGGEHPIRLVGPLGMAHA
jgi:hypothetical protein